MVQAFSPNGRCKTFEASADGYGRGEGCVALVLKPAYADDRPSEDGDSAHGALAVMRGSAVNQDGRSSSLTAPHGPSQAVLVTKALAAAGDSAH